jgi:hypothetical protein
VQLSYGDNSPIAWCGMLTEGGHGLTLYDWTQQRIRDRARAILASRGIIV